MVAISLLTRPNLYARYFNFYMPGEADGIFSRQYSPCSAFLYPPFNVMDSITLLAPPGPTLGVFDKFQDSLGSVAFLMVFKAAQLLRSAAFYVLLIFVVVVVVLPICSNCIFFYCYVSSIWFKYFPIRSNLFRNDQNYFVLLPNFELCKGTLGFFRVPLETSVFIRVPQGSQGSIRFLFLKVPLDSLRSLRIIQCSLVFHRIT